MRRAVDPPKPDEAEIPRLRRGVPDDARRLAAFAALTFEETFAHSTSAEHMAEHLSSAYGVPQQTRELQSPDYVTLLMESDAALVAFAQVRRHPAPEVVTGGDAIELHRFYVASAWHGRGLAQQLMGAVKATAFELGGQQLWLSVWEHNARGIAFYGKCGFRDVGGTDFWIGSDRQTDRLMVARVRNQVDA
ncbi:MAG: GNAT family N-acetyltransferase [Gemmatimonadaceae bacterium]